MATQRLALTKYLIDYVVKYTKDQFFHYLTKIYMIVNIMKQREAAHILSKNRRIYVPPLWILQFSILLANLFFQEQTGHGLNTQNLVWCL